LHGRSAEVDPRADRQKPRVVEIPSAFKTAMKKAGVLAAFKKLSYTHRKEYCRWITEGKKEETRTARLTKAIEMLKKGIKTPASCDTGLT
jgi:uncharacterized protein YdeI (YjbR/CyaY-like superfamily)